MHRYAAAVLKALKREPTLTFSELQEKSGLNPDALRWALENLSKEGYVELVNKQAERIVLSEEAKGYAKEGMPEEVLARKVLNGSIPISELTGNLRKIGLQWAKVKGYVIIENGNISISERGEEVARNGSEERRVLEKLLENPESYTEMSAEERAAVSELEKRKLVSIEKRNFLDSIKITSKGMDVAGKEETGEEIDELDRNMIVHKLWVGKSFKKYDVRLDVERIYPAMRHPLKTLIDSIKEAYSAMGFKEVRGPIVEPAFWVFDFLFVPQNHPARDKQDTFYLSRPEKMKIEDAMLMKRVKEVHEASWSMEWSKDVASEAVLRTHTTSVSAHQIYEIAKSKGVEFPVKLFSVGRVFRNENIDYKHTADFYQTDGIIIGERLTLANLFDTLIKIYSSLGIKIRFKPAYFPFVEPGVEVQLFYKPRNEWLEMGGAGIIRKEIISTTSRKKMSVLAWGLGVERILMVKYGGINTLPEMYNNGIGWLRGKRVF